MPRLTRKELITRLNQWGFDRIGDKYISRAARDELDTFYEEQRRQIIPDHLSPSQVDTWRKCQLVWYFRYIRGEKMPPVAAMTLGSMVDTGINFNLAEKIQTGKPAPFDAVADVVNEDYKARKDSTNWEAFDPNTFAGYGQQLIKAHYTELAPLVQPLEVQPTWRAKMVDQADGREWFFVCRPDAVGVDLSANNQKRIHENKCRTPMIKDGKPRKKSVDKFLVNYLEQLTANTAVAHAMTGEILPVNLDQMFIKAKGRATTERQSAARTAEEINRYWRTVNAVRAQIVFAVEENIWVPMEKQNQSRLGPNTSCTPEWCGYYKLCHEVF